MRNQLMKWFRIVGKTIAQVEDLGDEVFFRFTDGSYVVIESFELYNGGANLRLLREPPNDYLLKEGGVIDKEEYDERVALRDADLQACREKDEKKLLRDLLKKYGS